MTTNQRWLSSARFLVKVIFLFASYSTFIFLSKNNSKLKSIKILRGFLPFISISSPVHGDFGNKNHTTNKVPLVKKINTGHPKDRRCLSERQKK